jgi:hypothetical protein
LDAYDTIALKLKGDGRCYISTVSILSTVYLIREGNRKSALVFVVVAY